MVQPSEGIAPLVGEVRGWEAAGATLVLTSIEPQPVRGHPRGDRGRTLIERAVGDHRPGTIDYDAELRLHNEVLRRVYSLRRDDYVLDIGCGTGKTTRDAAQIAVDGSVVRIDFSEQMIDRARELTEAEGLGNVTFVHGDAQVHPFALERFDVAISRFGTMFFSDSVAAEGSDSGRAKRSLLEPAEIGHPANDPETAGQHNSRKFEGNIERGEIRWLNCAKRYLPWSRVWGSSRLQRRPPREESWSGRLAQRKSARFTPERSAVRTSHRPRDPLLFKA